MALLLKKEKKMCQIIMKSIDDTEFMVQIIVHRWTKTQTHKSTQVLMHADTPKRCDNCVLLTKSMIKNTKVIISIYIFFYSCLIFHLKFLSEWFSQNCEKHPDLIQSLNNFFPRIDDSPCNRFHSCLNDDHCLEYGKELTLYQATQFRLAQIESICRQQIKMLLRTLKLCFTG